LRTGLLAVALLEGGVGSVFSVSFITPQIMANWYYYSQDGAKISVTSVEELKQRAKLGMITPNTIIENEEGKRAKAGKVKGLTFAEVLQPPIQPIPALPAKANPPPIKDHIIENCEWIDGYGWAVYLGGLIFLALIVIVFQTFPSVERIGFMIFNAIISGLPIIFGLAMIILIISRIFGQGFDSPQEDRKPPSPMTIAKQRCGTIGGLFLVIGLALCWFGNHLNSQNRTLLLDGKVADRAFRDAGRQLQAIDIENLDQVQAATETFTIARQEWSRVDERMRHNTHSPGLINLLFTGGVFLFLFGFVLTVVGWCIPPEQNKQK
jgi:hypothetical protein